MIKLVQPTAAELRRLRPTSVAVWRALIRCRDRQGPSDAWFTASLHELARWARCSYTMAYRAVSELRSAGLITTHRERGPKWVTRTRHLEHADDTNMYLVFGSLVSRRGVDRIEFPAEPWRSFVENGHAVAVTKPLPNELPNGADFIKLAEELEGQRGDAYITNQILSDSETSKKAAGAADPLDDRLADLIAADDDDESLPDFIGVIGSIAPPLTPLGPRERAPYLPPDKPAPPPILVEYIAADQVDENKARQVVDGYRRAVKEVYGQEWWHFSKGDIKRSKYYARLLKCAEAMSDHSVPPEHWAIWRLRWFQKGRFKKTIPPIWIVMSAKTVSERAGWFRKEYQLPVPTVQHDPIIAEQHLRNREARRRWRGLTGVDVFMFAFPQWYVTMRQREIEIGFDDPHACWPTKRGSKYGREGEIA